MSKKYWVLYTAKGYKSQYNLYWTEGDMEMYLPRGAEQIPFSKAKILARQESERRNLGLGFLSSTLIIPADHPGMVKEEEKIGVGRWSGYRVDMKNRIVLRREDSK